jgi:hypothetical protein
VTEHGSQGSRVASRQSHSDRSEAGGRAGGDQPDSPSGIAVEDRACKEERELDREEGDGSQGPRDVDHQHAFADSS